jgi:hypothetical protein
MIRIDFSSGSARIFKMQAVRYRGDDLGASCNVPVPR